MEIVVQLVVELLGSLVSVAIGLVLGSVALVAMLGLRRAHARVARSSEVRAPDGEIWSVRVVYGLSRPLSTRLTGMSGEARRERRRAGHRDTEVGSDEIWHPKRLLDAYDEAAGLVAPFVVIAAIAIGLLFVVEMLVAVPVGLVFLVLSSLRGHWQVEVVDPAGARSIVDVHSLAEARATVAHTAERIAGGVSP